MLLVADDDPELAKELVKALAPHGVEVASYTDGASALLHVGSERPDMVLASSSLAGIGAVDFVRAVRLALSAPVLIGIDGTGDATEALAVLSAGATACVARPYRVPELLPLIRPSRPPDPGAFTVGPISLNAVSYEVRLDGRPLHLPLREFELLHYLMRHADRVVTRDEIRREVWHTSEPVSANTIAVHVKRLRARLGATDDTIIQTVRGVGYRLTSP